VGTAVQAVTSSQHGDFVPVVCTVLHALLTALGVQRILSLGSFVV
jgi:hypothetical protein